MKDLMRSLAPISDAAWEEIEEEARRTLKTALAARKIVDFTGPLGWDSGAIETGRKKKLKNAPRDTVEASIRTPQPLVEFRVPFTLELEELLDIDRGAADANLDPVREAAFQIALAEDTAIFHGYEDGCILGIFDAAKDQMLTITDDYQAYPAVVAQAISEFQGNGIAGPYAIALGPRCFTGLTQTTENGFPVIDHLRRLLDGPIIPARGIDGACVVSMRGGDFELTVGRDFSIGFLDHDAKKVDLYIEESFTFRPLGPEAAVPLSYARKKKG